MSKIRSLTIVGVLSVMTLGLSAPAFADRDHGWGDGYRRGWERGEERHRWEERERREAREREWRHEEREREWRRAEWYRYHHNIPYPGDRY